MVTKRGVSSIGRVLNADEVPIALSIIHGIANGDDWTQTSLAAPRLMQAVHDIRAYYEEAALELTNGPTPGGRQTEAWFFLNKQKLAGRSLLRAKQYGQPVSPWRLVLPRSRSPLGIMTANTTKLRKTAV